jgi:hypothetical protein
LIAIRAFEALTVESVIFQTLAGQDEDLYTGTNLGMGTGKGIHFKELGNAPRK